MDNKNNAITVIPVNLLKQIFHQVSIVSWISLIGITCHFTPEIDLSLKYAPSEQRLFEFVWKMPMPLTP
jgi:hypothetical protein